MDLKNWVVLTKKCLFESRTLICLLGRVPLHRWPVYVSAIGLLATGPVSAQFVLFLLPGQELLIDMGVSTFAGPVVPAFPLKVAYICGFLFG